MERCRMPPQPVFPHHYLLRFPPVGMSATHDRFTASGIPGAAAPRVRKLDEHESRGDPAA